MIRSKSVADVRTGSIILGFLLIASLAGACYSGFPQTLFTQHCLPGASANDFPLRVDWCLELALPISHPVQVKDGTIYVRTTNNLSQAIFYAIDANTSRILWQYSTDQTNGQRPLGWVIVGDYLITGGDSHLESIQRFTGQRVWQNGVDAETVATDGVTLYVASGEHARAIDPATGQTRWDYHGLPSHMTYFAFYNASNSTLVVPADYYYVFDAKSGHLMHKSESEPINGNSRATFFKNYLIYGNAVIDPATGDLIYDLPNGDPNYPPLVVSKTVYYVIPECEITSWNLDTRETNWTYDPKSCEVLLSNLSALDGYGFMVTDDDKIRSVSLTTGEEVGKWSGPKSSYKLKGNSTEYVPFPGLTASDDSLYVSFGTNLLYAFEPR